MKPKDDRPLIWTIGHSTRSLDELVEMLKNFDIRLLADVRSYPGSRKFPWFNKDNLTTTIPERGIGYTHIQKLGGRRKGVKDSKNIAWHHPAFRHYADYMETEDFQEGIQTLIGMAMKKRTAYMCSEAVWWRCHRSMISDYLKMRGWKVLHIMGKDTVKEHPYSAPALVIDGKLHYDIIKEEDKTSD